MGVDTLTVAGSEIAAQPRERHHRARTLREITISACATPSFDARQTDLAPLQLSEQLLHADDRHGVRANRALHGILPRSNSEASEEMFRSDDARNLVEVFSTSGFRMIVVTRRANFCIASSVMCASERDLRDLAQSRISRNSIAIACIFA